MTTYYNIAQFNNTVPLTPILENDIPLLQYNIGGARGGRITSLSLAFNTSAQQNAYFKVSIDGVNIQPAEFQAPSQTFNTFNYIQSGDFWELNPNATLKVYAYNEGNTAVAMLFDLLATIKQFQ